MPRGLGSIPRTWFESDRVMRAYYIKMDWPTTGTIRWATRQLAPFVDTENRDVGDGNGSVAWDSSHDWNVGNIQEGASGFTISDLIFGNSDYSFSDLIYLNGGLEGVPVNVWVAAFNADPPHAWIDARPLFYGEFERAEVTSVVQCSIVPAKHPMRRKFPSRRIDVAHGFKYVPKDGNKLAWGSDYHTLPAAPNDNKDPASPGGPITGNPRMPVIPAGGGGGRVPRTVDRGAHVPRTVNR